MYMILQAKCVVALESGFKMNENDVESLAMFDVLVLSVSSLTQTTNVVYPDTSSGTFS
jgi:hypothetical protein